MVWRKLLYLGIFVFALHNGEEALTMRRWMKHELPAVTERLEIDVRPPTIEQFHRGLLVITIAGAAIVLVAARGGPRSIGVYVCLFFYAVLFWNALVPHVALSAFTGRYTPGVVSAALVNLPYTVYLFHRALRERQATRPGLAVVLGFAAGLYPLAMLSLWRLGGAPTAA